MRFSDLIHPTNLTLCFADVRRRSQAPGIDGVKPSAYAEGLERRLDALSASLGDGFYRPSGVVCVLRDKPGGGVRRLSIPTVEDRIVIEALRRALEPAIEPRLSEAAYAYRPGRSARRAVEAVQERITAGAAWVALADVREFFDTVPLRALMDAVRDIVADEGVTRVLRVLLDRHAARPGRGLAQGSALSPVLSNLVLTPLDRALVTGGFRLVRYCDNLCISTESRGVAGEALTAMEREVERLGLALKREASRVAAVREGFLWLGFWLGPNGSRVGDGAVQALRAKLDAAGAGLDGERLRARLLPIVHGWAQYFDVPLPESATLGRHDAVARGLLREIVGAPEPRDDAGEPASTTAACDAEMDGEGDFDPWHEIVALPDGPEATSDRRGEALTRLLDEADRRAAGGDYAGADAAYEEAQRLAHHDGLAPPPVEGAGPVCDEEAIDAFLGLFCAGQAAFETAPPSGPGRRGFTLVDRPPGPRDVREHLAGRAAMAIRPRLPDGTCTLGVLDLDETGDGDGVAVKAHAQALASVARAWGLSVLVEETGGRGVHLWFPVDARIPARAMARSLAALERAAGTPAPSVRIERLPGDDGAPDLHAQAMTLPLGVHVETGTRSRLAGAGGREVREDLAGLLDIQPAAGVLFARSAHVAGADEPTPAVQAAPNGVALPDWSSFGKSVVRVMDGCAVLRHLAGKAVAVGHLSHAERLSLLYSLGHLGPPGEQAIHAIVGACQNYDARETSGQIARRTGLPIGCTRMREKHATPELLPLCACEFGDVRRRGGYPTPLLHAAGFRRAWRDVLQDRRAVEHALRADPPPGIIAAPADAMDVEGAAANLGAPPHEWA